MMMPIVKELFKKRKDCLFYTSDFVDSHLPTSFVACPADPSSARIPRMIFVYRPHGDGLVEYLRLLCVDESCSTPAMEGRMSLKPHAMVGRKESSSNVRTHDIFLFVS
jgi:hypothetical protein